MQYLNYTDQDIIDKAKEAQSLGELVVLLGLVKAGGNYRTISKKAELLNIETSHWRKNGFNKGRKFKDYHEYTRPKNLKTRLIEENGHTCELCKLSTWLDKPIMIELHHMDGNKYNNEKSNLQLLCPNCHSTTDNWRRKKSSLVS